MITDLDNSPRVTKIAMLAIMLEKLNKLYPQFAEVTTWEEAHRLLADFCLPEELKHILVDEYNDVYYHDLIARHLGIPIRDVTRGFQIASELAEFKS
jgi:hypothetical protein